MRLSPVAFPFAVTLLGAAGLAQTPYPALTDHPAEVPMFFPEPFTGLAVASNEELFAVNPMGNKVVSSLGKSIDTGLNPISIAIVENRPEPGDRKLLVVCAGTHGLFVHDAHTGLVEAFRTLESEPADIAYDEQSGLAFVTCQGTNAVLEFDPIDGLDSTVRHVIEVGQRPGYIYLDPRGARPARVYFAAGVTGNNTITNPDPDLIRNFGSVLSLDGNPEGELDDFDVHVIDLETGALSPAIKRCGSLLFDLERFPGGANQPVWVLATESKNADPSLPDEPSLNGQFAVNRLQRVANVQGTVLREGGVGDDLDDWLAGQPYSSEHSINQARALDFAFGRAYVASPFSDIIIELDASGMRTRELVLPPGAQCYDIEPIGDKLFALCLGTLTVESFRIQPIAMTPGVPVPKVPALANPIDLAGDPTPPELRRGRDVFLDGKLSADGRFSCASCHPRAMSDQLGWQLSDVPNDVKDVMVTQSLVGIADTFPHHWRGERDLFDFRGAFAGLLGAVDEPSGPGADITEAQMDDLVAFLQSLLAPANPLQDLSRMVLDSQSGGPMHNQELPPTPIDPAASAEQGVSDFQTVLVPQDGNATCAACHTYESGTNGNVFPVNQGEIPRGLSTEVAHFRQLQNKGRLGKEIHFDFDGDGVCEPDETPPEVCVVPNNGFGFGHAGRRVSMREFSEGFEATVDPLAVANMILYIDQFDQGTAPACHWGIWLDAGSDAGDLAAVPRVLLSGNTKEWNDVAVVGRHAASPGAWVPMKWWYDPGSQQFEPEDPALPALDWTAMKAALAAGEVEGAFLGLPPASGERFAIDFDGDGQPNGTDPAPTVFDDPGDNGFLPDVDSVVVDHASAVMAKLKLVFNEPVTYSITYWADPTPASPGSGDEGPVRTVWREDFVQTDTIHLTHSEPSSPAFPAWVTTVLDTPFFVATIDMTDRSSNTRTGVPLEETPGQPLFVPDPVFPENLEFFSAALGASLQHVEILEEAAAPAPVPGGVTFTVRVRVRSNLGAPNYVPPVIPGELDDPFPSLDLSVGNESVFLSVAHNASGKFEKAQIGTGAGEMTSPFAKAFDTNDGTTSTDYELPPGEPWIVTDFVDANGDATFTFTLYGLATDTKVAVAPMGILEEAVGLHTPADPVFERASLAFFQMLRRDEMVSNPTHLELTVP